jgi:hypothetical protein
VSEGVPIGHTSEAWVGWVVRQILGILRILAKKNYCAVIASHRRSNPYACRLLRHFIPRNDNLTEDLNLVYNKPLSAFLLKRGRRDNRWIARPLPLSGYPERTNKLPYFILRFMRWCYCLINQTSTF